MKDLVWDSLLSVGVEEIDDDHRKLVNLFNILNHSVTEEASADYVRAVFEELINCTVWHFSHEERLMLKYGYEGTEEHKAVHQELINSARELQQQYLQVGKLEKEEDLKFLERWLTQHILVDELILGSYLTEVM